MRKNTYHARDGTRRKRTLLGMVGVLTAILVGLLPQQVVEASWADEHHNTAVALYGGIGISGGWYYDRSYGGSDFGQQNIHTERVDYWGDWLLSGIATGGIGTYDKGWKYHYNTGLSVKDWNFNGDPITCNVYGDTVGLTPVFIAYGDQNQKTGYTTSYSSYGSTSSYYATIGGRPAYVTEVGNYCSNVGIGRSFTPNTNTLHFHDGAGNWKCAFTATYDKNNNGLLNRSYDKTGYTQVGWCTADDGQSNHTQIYNSSEDAQKAGYWSFDTVWNNDMINFVCAVRGTTSGAAVELYPVYEIGRASCRERV